MARRSTSDMLRGITPRTLLPFILVGIAVVWAYFMFARLKFSLISIIVIIMPLVGIAFLSLYHKMLPLLIFAVLVPIEIPVTATGLLLPEVLVPLLVGVYILQRMIRRSEYNRVSLSTIPWSIYFVLVIGFISYIVSGDLLPQNLFRFQELGSFRSYYKFFIGVLGYVMVLSLLKEEGQIRQVIKVMFWISLLGLLYLYGLVVLFRINTPLLPRHAWSIDYFTGGRFPIRCIAMGQMGILLFVTAICGEYVKGLKFKAPLLFLAAASIILAGGRAVFLGWVGALLFYVYLRRHYLIFSAATFLAIVAISIPILKPEVVDFLPEQVQRIFQYRAGKTGSGARSIEVRLKMWQMSLEDIRRKPFTGVGFRGFDIRLAIYGQLKGEELFAEMGVRSGATHNGYIAWAQVFGIPGLLFFLIIYLGHLMRAWKMYYRHADPHVRNFSMYALLMLVARSMNLLAGGGPKELTFFLHLGLIQSVWVLVLKHRRASRLAELEEQVAAERKLAYAAALEGE